MFTGIVAAIGSIRQVSPLGEDGVRLDVAAGELDMSDVAIGDSIAIQGACMTVVEMADEFAKNEYMATPINVIITTEIGRAHV